MRLPEEPEHSLQINIVPMIDVIFAVLAFFILSSLFLTRSEGLPVNLPTATTADSQLKRQVTVTITAGGDLLIDDQPVNPDQVQATVQTLIPTDQTSLVVIQADQQVPHGQVVSVMDQLRQIPNLQLAIATTPP